VTRRRGAVLLAVAGTIACRIATAPAQVAIAPPPTVSEPIGADAEVPPPAILSAHLGIVDALALDGLDALPVVFSGDIDAASLRPEVFQVMFGDGGRVTPKDARLAPASENDENRTVLLIGDFGDPTSRPPTDVMVVGRLFGEGGESFEGLVIEVDPFEVPGRAVLAERMPGGPGACEGAAQAIRTYWIDGLRGVAREDLAGIKVTLQDGTTVVPVAFDDHDLEDDSGDDNVLDLCVAESSPATRVDVAAALFADPPGHPSAAVRIDVTRARALPMASATARQ
jgi:hypothetical protein